MMLTVAIISLVLILFHFNTEQEKLGMGIFSISTIAWWNICFPLSIILMGLWILVTIIKINN